MTTPASVRAHVARIRLHEDFNHFLASRLRPGMSIDELKIKSASKCHKHTTAFLRLHETQRHHELIELLNNVYFRGHKIRAEPSRKPRKPFSA
jgi:hypothetical protein